ncbi:coenzyme F420-0:L-glutamate ligase [Ornithinimicrobium sp. Y1694]|uniref:coenzyme F420-0:L-glutamate ligase n=1 Tax=Ornithinimicrobium sp. Y1694 TaxID=3418590 RepID=UPI003CFA7BF5
MTNPLHDIADGLLVLPLRGLPEVDDQTDLAGELLARLAPLGGLRDGDLLVVSSKLISKADGLRRTTEAGPEAGQDALLRERLVLEESVRVVAERATSSGRITRIVEAVAGPVMAAAGLDASNTGPHGGVLVLPRDPDGAAESLRAQLAERAGVRRVGVILSDTAGRPWRGGLTDFALGAAGVQVLDDLRGGRDSDGRPLQVTARAVADELAAAADLVKGKADAVGAAVLRGPVVSQVVGGAEGPGARSLVRTGPGDWFATGHLEAVRAALGAAPGTEAAREVGIPSLGIETDEARGERAVRLALLGQPEVRVEGSPTSRYAVHAPDPVRAGRVAARLEIALHAEGLSVDVTVA